MSALLLPFREFDCVLAHERLERVDVHAVADVLQVLDAEASESDRRFAGRGECMRASGPRHCSTAGLDLAANLSIDVAIARLR
jgi:hypothetical protein